MIQRKDGDDLWGRHPPTEKGISKSPAGCCTAMAALLVDDNQPTGETRTTAEHATDSIFRSWSGVHAAAQILYRLVAGQEADHDIAVARSTACPSFGIRVGARPGDGR